jgi:hypothetical protein
LLASSLWQSSGRYPPPWDLIYVLAYVGDRPSLRTLLWSVGLAVNITIFFLPAFHH